MRNIIVPFFFVFAFCLQVNGQNTVPDGPKHIVKFNILPLAVGEVMPSYEFVINEKFGIEGGIGFVTENYLNQFVQESNFGNTRQVKMGPSFLISSRYYPFKKADYIYCKGEIRYRRYKEIYQELNSSGEFQIIDEYERKVIPRIGVGYHLYLDEHFLFDISTNAGLTFIKDFQFGYDSAIKNTKLHFGLGFKFAYVI
ncbi:MAG: hypothetical protein ISP70_05655 [Crocinitomicaceae bacterium]|nr:hypothetical protein [Crocinitomicaceae bacterium]